MEVNWDILKRKMEKAGKCITLHADSEVQQSCSVRDCRTSRADPATHYTKQRRESQDKKPVEAWCVLSI
jgi:hypothetical protein